MGKFNFKYNAAVIDKLSQEAGRTSRLLLDAQTLGQLPLKIPTAGYDNLIGKDGNQKTRQSAKN